MIVSAGSATVDIVTWDPLVVGVVVALYPALQSASTMQAKSAGYVGACALVTLPTVPESLVRIVPVVPRYQGTVVGALIGVLHSPGGHVGPLKAVWGL